MGLLIRLGHCISDKGSSIPRQWIWHNGSNQTYFTALCHFLLPGRGVGGLGCYRACCPLGRLEMLLRHELLPESDVFMSTTTWTGFGLSSSSDWAHPPDVAPSLALVACPIYVCLNLYGWTMDNELWIDMQVDLVFLPPLLLSCSPGSSSIFGVYFSWWSIRYLLL